MIKNFILFLAFACIPLHANKTKQELMLHEIETVANFFDICYGPRDYKINQFSWDPILQLEIAKNKILHRENITAKEFHQILLEYCSSVKDYHVSLHFCSTACAKLPFEIKRAQNRYFLMEDRKAIAEISHYNGLPVDYVVNSLRKRFFNLTNEATDKDFATELLCRRSGWIGIPVLQGSVNLKIIHENETKDISLPWEYQPEKVCFTPLRKKKNLKHDYTTPLYRKFSESNIFAAEDSYVPVFGSPALALPKKFGKPFNGNVYEIESGEKIGYVRIPHFEGRDKDTELFRQTIEYLEGNSDALVIDITGNPGGNIFYLMALLSSLIEEPIPNFYESFRLNHRLAQTAFIEIEMCQEQDALLYLRSFSKGYAFNEDSVDQYKSFYTHLLNEWSCGKQYSDAYPIQGLDYIMPDPKVRYTKPIILIVDQFCFSCADIFPALMQDSGRALIFGKTTAGAGGAVETIEYPNQFGIETLSITLSIAYRSNGKSIENEGVTPDVIYEVTPEDLFNGYEGYRKALVDAIKQHLQL